MPMTPTASDITTDIRPPAKKTIPWKSAPLTVGTISTSSGLAYLLDAPAGVDIAEIRLDLLLSKGVSLIKFKKPSQNDPFPLCLPFAQGMRGQFQLALPPASPFLP